MTHETTLQKHDATLHVIHDLVARVRSRGYDDLPSEVKNVISSLLTLNDSLRAEIIQLDRRVFELESTGQGENLPYSDGLEEELRKAA